MLASAAPWRLLGWFGIGLGAFRLITAVIKITSESHWSDVVSIAGFLAFLLWVFTSSVMMVVTMRRSMAFAARAAA